MTRITATLLAAAGLTLAASAVHAQAQTAAAPAAATAAKPYYSVDTTFGDLMADPKAKAVVDAFFTKRDADAGKPPTSPEEKAKVFEMIKGASPRQIALYPQANLDETALATLDAQLAKVPAPAQ